MRISRENNIKVSLEDLSVEEFNVIKNALRYYLNTSDISSEELPETIWELEARIDNYSPLVGF